MNITIWLSLSHKREREPRIEIINSGVNIKKMLDDNGYPLKSKQHSHNLDIWWHNKDKNEYNLSLKRYLGIIESTTKFRCPKSLQYQFTNAFELHCSDKCCLKLKKEPFKQWQLDNNKTITLTGMRKEEGGKRASINCVVFDKDNHLKKFHPLLVVSNEWEDEFIKRNNVKLCKLYYPPYNFKRTGCRCCPFSITLQDELNQLWKLSPMEYKASINLWKPVFDEYIRIGYRLKYYPHNTGVQFTIYDYEE